MADYFDVISNIVVMHNYLKIEEAIKAASETGESLFNILKCYLLPVNQNIIEKGPDKEQIYYFSYKDDGEIRRGIFLSCTKELLPDEFHDKNDAAYHYIYEGIDIDSGKHVSISDFDTFFEHNFDNVFSLSNMQFELLNSDLNETAVKDVVNYIETLKIDPLRLDSMNRGKKR